MSPPPRHEWFADRERLDARWDEVIALISSRPEGCDDLVDRLREAAEDPQRHSNGLTPFEASLIFRLAFIGLGEALLRADEPR